MDEKELNNDLDENVSGEESNEKDWYDEEEHEEFDARRVAGYEECYDDAKMLERIVRGEEYVIRENEGRLYSGETLLENPAIETWLKEHGNPENPIRVLLDEKVIRQITLKEYMHNVIHAAGRKHSPYYLVVILDDDGKYLGCHFTIEAQDECGDWHYPDIEIDTRLCIIEAVRFKYANQSFKLSPEVCKAIDEIIRPKVDKENLKKCKLSELIPRFEFEPFEFVEDNVRDDN